MELFKNVQNHFYASHYYLIGKLSIKTPFKTQLILIGLSPKASHESVVGCPALVVILIEVPSNETGPEDLIKSINQIKKKNYE